MQIGNCVKEYNWIIINHSELSKKLHHHIEVAIFSNEAQFIIQFDGLIGDWLIEYKLIVKLLFHPTYVMICYLCI